MPQYREYEWTKVVNHLADRKLDLQREKGLLRMRSLPHQSTFPVCRGQPTGARANSLWLDKRTTGRKRRARTTCTRPHKPTPCSHSCRRRHSIWDHKLKFCLIFTKIPVDQIIMDIYHYFIKLWTKSNLLCGPRSTFISDVFISIALYWNNL